MRNKALDVLKAWGIILVIMGHINSPLNTWIYSFHMPLFFFASGFLRYGAEERPWGEFLKRKAMTSLVPYVVFWFVSVILYRNLISLVDSGSFAQFGFSQIKGLVLGGHWLSESSNNFPLWYLQLYFIAVIVLEGIVRWMKPVWKIVCFVFLVFITVPFQTLLPGRPAFHINVLPAALVFMLFGYAVHFVLARRQIPPSAAVGGVLVIIGWNLSIGGNISAIRGETYFFSAFCTILGLFLIAERCSGIKLFQRIGEKTLYIMGLHMLTLRVSAQFADSVLAMTGWEHEYVRHLIITASALAICCAIAELVQRIRNRLGTRRLKMPGQR